MLLHGMSLAFVGVSHKLKLTSLGSHLSAVGHSLSIPSLCASLCFLWVLGPLAQVGVFCRRDKSNSGFMEIVTSILHRDANLRQLFSIIIQLTVPPTTLDQAVFEVTKMTDGQTDHLPLLRMHMG